MRITNSYQADMLSQNIETGLSSLSVVQQQIASGKKLTTFSDDPAGASQSLTLRASLSDNAQYQRDATSATAFLSASDGALTSVNTLIQSAQQIAVQGANSTQSADSLASLSSQVNDIIQQVTQTANTQSQGRYLFGGTNTKAPPYDSTQTYQGNTQAINATVGPGYTVQLNTIGSAAFGPAFTALQSLKTDLGTGDATAISSDIGKFDTALSAVNAAQADVGSKANQVTAVTQQLTRAQGEYQNSLSNIEDVDLATAYVQLQSAQNIYQASLATTSKAFQYSLADFLH